MRLPTLGLTRRPEPGLSDTPWLVVGLGNPGREYAATRHNIGAMVTERLAGSLGGALTAHRRCRAEVFEGRFGPLGHGATRVVLARSRGYMNESGGPVACLAEFYKVPLEQIVVLHDELDLPLGGLRLKLGGGDNGHNGLRSLRRSLGSGEFYRVRLGIGRPPGRQDPADFVLKPFAGAERTEVDLLLGEAVDAVEVLVREGLAAAQNLFNR
jgi:PTH1 family peptidyl-tRNA hydrolase